MRVYLSNAGLYVVTIGAMITGTFSSLISAVAFIQSKGYSPEYMYTPYPFM